jgi:hypothetical protein
MKQIGLALLAFSIFSYAQGTRQPAPGQQSPVDIQKSRHSEITVSNTPTPNDMYCSGFITTQRVPEAHYIVGGQNSPDQVHYAGTTDRVFIWGAADLKAGDRLEILRHVKNPNRSERFRGEKAAIKQVGEPYFERGYVRVLEVQKNVAIAVPDLSCGDIIPGDLAIPFVEREQPVFRAVSLDRYAVPNGKVTGRILMANEFDSLLGTTKKVYLNIGEDKGLKVGDYLRVTRTYDYKYRDYESGLSAKATETEDMMNHPPKFPKGNVKDWPRLTLGDMVVLHVHPRSATAMILTTLEDIRVGDWVELMDAGGAPESAAPSATPPR